MSRNMYEKMKLPSDESNQIEIAAGIDWHLAVAIGIIAGVRRIVSLLLKAKRRHAFPVPTLP